ncbi:hypothetical protein, partial [Cronobacter sakazakii]|uniref:hypothetical protein n=1 Tax=Cronobacter sakazakii TaxID=28141 RepID=UPI002233E896
IRWALSAACAALRALARAMAASTAALRGSTGSAFHPLGAFSRLRRFARFGAGNGGFDGSFARVDRFG